MRVLLVEDDEILTTLVAEILTGEGHRVACAATPEHALALLGSRAWDLVVTDSFGVDYDAPSDEEVAQLRSLATHAPVVMITGRTWTARVKPAELGVAAILTKPFDLDDLLRSVEAAGRGPTVEEPCPVTTHPSAR